MKRRSFLRGLSLFSLTPFIPNIVVPPIKYEGVIDSITWFNKCLPTDEMIKLIDWVKQENNGLLITDLQYPDKT